jgi:hypothetical protein
MAKYEVANYVILRWSIEIAVFVPFELIMIISAFKLKVTSRDELNVRFSPLDIAQRILGVTLPTFPQ